MGEVGQLVADADDPAAVQLGGGDQDPAVAQVSRCRIGSGPKAANSGERTLRCLSVPERDDVGLQPAAEQGEDGLPGADAERVEDRREPVRQPAQLLVGVLVHRPVEVDAAQRDPVAVAVTTCRSTASYAMLPPGRGQAR